MHPPDPSQTAAGRLTLPLHAAFWQVVPCAGNVQALPFVPSQVPLQAPEPPHAGRGATGAPWIGTQSPR
jgi:hypothetical protein